ncbi:RNA polymerase sigma factor [Rhabdobacter roseus]|uniref:RNA polymerase sigma-70 factor (ECF subfamily) n=1 Tax=Rhabdobacter roseus TaxID=1655419 RepID=A0A840TU54_9BACT|nr:sigma-70 family RNA polymerase sigma factor [Rhabdobacter roseus]MBB5287481.1 RNA polymerase sigma-70 factor (ECF subfamily) [Rhabdobacter roseus]
MTEPEFLSLIEQHQGLIHKLCRLYRDTPEDREDLFQEIVYQLWRSKQRFEQRAKVTTWMYRVGLNTALASLRQKAPRLHYPGTLPEQTDAPDENLLVRQEQLLWALKQLNEADRSLIALYLEDISYQEIAEITGLSVGNVGVKLNRIKKKIQNLLTS